MEAVSHLRRSLSDTNRTVIALAVLSPIVVTAILLSIAWLFLKPDVGSIQIGDVANWLQILVALWLVAVTSFLALQIIEVQKQTNLQQEKANSEAYKALIGPHLQSIRRFINTADVGQLLDELDIKLASVSTSGLRLLLEQFRADVDYVATRVKLPLLGRDVSLDDIEALLSEYNFLCKLLLKGTISDGFATDMAMVNFVGTYNRLLPFIRLRQRLSEKYASHFTEWVDAER